MDPFVLNVIKIWANGPKLDFINLYLLCEGCSDNVFGFNLSISTFCFTTNIFQQLSQMISCLLG